MPRPKKRRQEGEDPFDALDTNFYAIRRHMDRILERMLSGELSEGDDPLIYGLSMRRRPDGRPIFRELGNAVAPDEEAPGGREPLIDIMETEDEVRVIMELPGVDKEDIRIEAFERSLELEVDSEHRRFTKLLELPCDVATDSARANCKNGVLEVVLRRRAPRKKGKAIKVE